MITYTDLVRPLSEGGHYSIFRITLHNLFDILQPTDRVLLYQCHMFDSSQMGKSALVVSGPGRSLDDPDNPPKRIGNLPSNFKELEGEVDVQSLREGMKDYEEPSPEKCTRIVGGDGRLGATLWNAYQCNHHRQPASAYTDDARKRFQELKKLGLIEYRRRRPQGWSLTEVAWDALEG